MHMKKKLHTNVKHFIKHKSDLIKELLYLKGLYYIQSVAYIKRKNLSYKFESVLSK
jgi:hypothetical protein